MRKSLVLILLFGCLSMVYAQSKYSPLAQLFMQKQVGRMSLQRSVGEKPEQYVPMTIRTTDCDALSRAGIQVGTRAGEWVTAWVPMSVRDDLEAMPSVESVEAGRLAYPMLDKALPDIGYERMLQATDLPYPYLGKDVIVGVVDIGFQWDHIAFRREDGTSRIVMAWNQNDTTGVPPQGYAYGTVLDTEEKILSAAPCGIDIHATHVASIAAGSAFEGNLYGGVAREADLVLVDALHTPEGGMYSEGIVDGIQFIFDYARSVGKPCVVNLSIGDYFGPHDGTSAFDVMCDSLQGEGRLIVGAMGNMGAYNYHLGYNFDVQPRLFRTGFRQNRMSLPMVDIWSEAPVRIGIEIYKYNSETPECATSWIPTDSSFSEVSMAYEGKEILLQVATAFDEDNGLYNTMFLLSGVTHIEDAFFALVVEGEKGRLDMWNNASANRFDTFGREGWESGDNRMSLMEVGGTGRRITSVGAYVTAVSVAVRNGVYDVGYELHDLAPFSGRGATRDGRMKPETAAPGCITTAAFNRVLATDTANFFYGMTVADYEWRGEKYYYGANSGTSMASPIVAGVYALWLQACPTLTPERAKEVLAATSSHDAYTQDVMTMGYGKVNPYAGLCYLLGAGGISSAVKMAGSKLYPTVGCGSFSVLPVKESCRIAIEVYDLSGIAVCSLLRDGCTAGVPFDVNLPMLQSGVYQVRIIGDTWCEMLPYIWR